MILQNVFGEEDDTPISHGRLIEDFPTVDQRVLTGAEFRCGSIALGSWLIWLTEKEVLSAPVERKTESSPIFNQAGLTIEEQAILAEVDTLAGNTGEISLMRLIETLIQYCHRNAGDTGLEIYYYNLPNDNLLHQLVDSELPVILFQGIYRKNSQSKQLERQRGHYSCLIGKNGEQLIANTYAQNQVFTVEALPMKSLIENDRYRPTGSESYLYLRCPPEQYPRYMFRAFVPSAPQTARKQIFRGTPLFARPEETILIEGALAFRVVERH
ncbi:hypothetical protein [Coraliomargarita sinensis]|uniref:hypothetical protein n=1 Tax=Coraliomargarita sinensis TaxID=2174842 RepID=UPI0011B7C093|nr:hypothetical protein [Coraliomargarita sinensis]